MPNMSKIYANAVAKYCESFLLDGEKIKRIMDASYSDAVKMLYDYGYGGGIMAEGAEDVDTFMNLEMTRLLQFVFENSANNYISKSILNKYLYHNAKVIYKSKFVNVDTSTTLYSIEEDLSGIKEGDYSSLPTHLSEVLSELDNRFIDSAPNARFIDTMITKSMYNDIVLNARLSKSTTMINYVTSEIDLYNLLSAFRIKEMKLDVNNLMQMLNDGGSLPVNDLESILSLDYQQIPSLFCYTIYGDIVKSVCENSENRLVDFEKQIDDYLYDLTFKNRDNMLSFDPFINYYAAKLMELKVVKMVLVCLKNNVPFLDIKRRLRSIYE